MDYFEASAQIDGIFEECGCLPTRNSIAIHQWRWHAEQGLGRY